jgi:hypothetical protein
MEPETNAGKGAKQMLIEIFENKVPKKPNNAVYIEDECDELEAEESNEYFEPPTVPRSCNNVGNVHKVTHAFKDQHDVTLTSHIQESHSVGSTYSLQTFALEPPMEYEEIIQKLEADIRKHIRIQNQLKLHIESLQARVDEKEKAEVVKDKELDRLNEKVTKLKHNIIELDRKKEEEIKRVRDQGEAEIKRLNEKVQKLNKTIFEQTKSEGRSTIVAGAIPSSIERPKVLDSARSNTVSYKLRHCYSLMLVTLNCYDRVRMQGSKTKLLQLASRKHM